MPKIKNWTKYEVNGLTYFQHDRNTSGVVVDKPDTYSEWEVLDQLGFKIASLSTSKALAIKKAVAWIKRNPNG